MRFRKFFKVLVIIMVILVLLVIVNFLPTLYLGSGEMSVFVGDRINVYYENEKDAARDTFELADKRAEELAKLLGLDVKQDIDIYIYDNQKTMQRKKYGFIIPFLGLDWYIGDNIGRNVILTSPANPGSAHDYDSIKYAILHEIVHAFNHVINEDMTYWVDNGLAGYLSGQNPGDDMTRYGAIPTLEQTQVKGLIAPITFSNFNGYEYSYSYIKYIDNTYSWETIKTFAKNGDYKASFGVSEQEIYDGWYNWLLSGN